MIVIFVIPTLESNYEFFFQLLTSIKLVYVYIQTLNGELSVYAVKLIFTIVAVLCISSNYGVGVHGASLQQRE